MYPLLAVLTLLVVGTGCSANVDAMERQVTPNYLARGRVHARVGIDVSGVPDGTYCSDRGSATSDFCVARLRDAFRRGLWNMFGAYMTPVETPPAEMVASFALLGFEQRELEGPWRGNRRDRSRVQVRLRWAFALKDPSTGAPVLQVSDSTLGPVLLRDVEDGGDVIVALMNAVLERIAQAMNSDESIWARWPAASAPRRR